jgi:hypothetical protein
MTTGTLLASVRLARHLNGPAGDPGAVVGPDVAHHVVDPDDVAGLDPLLATDLETALPVLRARERDGWVLVLPNPGRLGGLRGPVAFNQAALGAGSAVIGAGAGLALVPQLVGPAVQWRLHRAHPPGSAPTSYEAERVLGEAILKAGRELAELDVAAGPTPVGLDADLGPAPGYPPRRRLAADRAARLLIACDLALDNDGRSLSSHEVDRRRGLLDLVRQAARDALVAAVSRAPAGT